MAMGKLNLVAVLVAVLAAVAAVHADIPTHCLHDQVLGTWELSVSSIQQVDSAFDVDCSDDIQASETKKIVLKDPSTAIDMETGEQGFWTMFYDEGFEVVIGGRKYFAFLQYKQDEQGNTESLCDRTFNGWVHDAADYAAKQWGCYSAKQTEAHLDFLLDNSATGTKPQPVDDDSLYQPDIKMIDAINSAQSSWTAKVYPEFMTKTVGEMRKMLGSPAHPEMIEELRAPRINFDPEDNANEASNEVLPDSFDWRNVSGVNYVTPVRDQGGCGSCYAFAATGMFEARYKIATKNTDEKIFSPQYVLSCSKYAQGCSGGFHFPVSKFAEDFGMVTEEEMPYRAETGECPTDQAKAADKQYFTGYQYVGGYQGAGDEQGMMKELVKNGPIAVSFMVYPDFSAYSGGVYHHTGLEGTNGVHPWEEVNHGVLVVGYGVTDQNEKYWIVKNSWGAHWGEQGYFRIRRGVDECAIESMAVSTSAVLQ